MVGRSDHDETEAELARLGELTLEELKARYAAIKGHALPKYMRRGLIELAVGHAIQEQAFGSLDRHTRKRLDTLVAGIVLKGIPKPKPRPKNRKLKPGTKLLREWQGRMHEIIVTPEGYLWRGSTWRSLTEIARTITGTNWNGWVFFGVKKAPSGGPRLAYSKEGTNESPKPAGSAVAAKKVRRG